MILIDNTVLSNFALVGSLRSVRRFCRGRGLTTRAVYQEFQAGVEKRVFQDTNLSWLRLTHLRNQPEKQRFIRYHRRLGAGEASCLAVASSRGHSLLTDDMMARKEAYRSGIVVSGSLGVLVALIRNGDLTLVEGNALLQVFLTTGYFSPINRLDDLI